MVQLLTAIGFALMTAQAFAQVQVPKSYSDGEVIDADELNTNLKAIADAVPPRNCTTDQIIKWDGSAWVCASKAIVEVICDPLLQCKAYCPAGTTVVSGGCSHSLPQDTAFMRSAEDGPLPDLDGWICTATFSEAGGVVATRAICQ